MNRPLIALSIVLLGFGAACDRSTTSPTPVAPPPPPVTPAPAAPVERPLNGYVSDTAFRPLGGVRVEVLSGPDAGKELTSDDQGRFTYLATLSERVSMRATKEGFVDATSTVISSSTLNMAWVFFQMSPVTQPVNPEGSYTLTIDLDSACQGFPDEVRTRSYEARLTSRSPTAFNGLVTGAQFAPYGNGFYVGVAGNYVAISTEGEGPTLIEQVGPKSYISYTGVAGASVPAGAAPTISAPFRGTIEYCELKAPIGQYYDCSETLAATRTECTSPNSHLRLTPR